jgi:hypothetical protein
MYDIKKCESLKIGSKTKQRHYLVLSSHGLGTSKFTIVPGERQA